MLQDGEAFHRNVPGDGARHDSEAGEFVSVSVPSCEKAGGR
jgi:hypothetical protein